MNNQHGSLPHSTRRDSIIFVFFTLCFCSVFISCGHRTTRGSPESSPTATTKTQARQFNLDDVLKQVDAVQKPDGVDPALFQKVKDEVKRLFKAKTSGKKVSVVPSGTQNKVTDLEAKANGPGTQATITWTEVLWGDYDNDGRVRPVDLVPVAAWYGQDVTMGNDDAHKLVNGDGPNNPEINMGDLPAVTDDYDAALQGYRVYRGHCNGGSVDWELNWLPNLPGHSLDWSVDRPAPPTSTRPSYFYADGQGSGFPPPGDLQDVRYKVVPYGDGGIDMRYAASDPATLQTNPHVVSGTVTFNGRGLPGVVVSLILRQDDSQQHPVSLEVKAKSQPTDSSGAFSIPGVYDGTYHVTPWKDGYTFNPWEIVQQVQGQDVTGLSFVGLAQGWQVSGMVHNATNGTPLGGVDVELQIPGEPYTALQSTTTNSPPTQPVGQFTFPQPVSTGYYRLAARKQGWWFGEQPILWLCVTTTGQAFSLDFGAYPALATTQWPKFRANMQNTGKTAFLGPQTVSDDPSISVTISTAGWITSSPAVGADGTVYFGGSLDPPSQSWGTRTVVALDPLTLSTKWIFTPPSTAPYLASSPAIASDGTIYVADWYTNVYALYPNGRVKWTHQLLPPPGACTESSVAVGQDGTVYIGCKFNTFYALSPVDGSVKWTFTVNSGTGAWGCPAFSEDYQTIYIGDEDGYVYALNLAGQQLWSARPSGTANSIRSSITVGLNGILYVQYSGLDQNPQPPYGVYALSPASGATLWSRTDLSTVGDWSTPAVGPDGTVYVGATDGLHALNPTSGSDVWPPPGYFACGEVCGSPAIGQDGTVYFATNYDGVVFALNPVGPGVKWQREKTGVAFLSSPAIAQFTANKRQYTRLFIGGYRNAPVPYKGCFFSFGPAGGP